MAVDDVPKASRIGPSRQAFKHQGGSAREQGPVQKVAVAGNPTNVGGTKVNLTRLVLKGVYKGVGRPNHVSGAGVHHSLGLAGGSAGVENEEQILGLHDLRLNLWVAHGLDAVNLVMQPTVAALNHSDRDLAVSYHQNGPQRSAAFCRLVDYRLERNHFSPAVCAVAGDDHLSLSVVDAVGQGLGAKASKNNRMHGPDASAG